MSEMSRPHLPYLLKQVTRHGRIVWYVRRGKGSRIRIHGEHGTPEFAASYQAALNGPQRAQESRPEGGTLSWLIGQYQQTNVWAGLAANTRASRQLVFKQLIEAAGNESASSITRQMIIAGRDRRTAGAAGGFVMAMRALFKWAFEAGHVPADPTIGIKKPKRQGDGHHTWTEPEMASYEARWPLGTRERVWLDVLAYTGLRRSDAVLLGRQHVKDGVITIRTKKTGAVVTIPIHPVLAQTLAAGPVGDLAFITGPSGKPLSGVRFAAVFRDACHTAGLSDCPPHGVRKIAATRAAEAGATTSELEAMFGWRGGQMASHYTKAADRQRLGRSGMAKVIARTSNPSPAEVRELKCVS